MRALTIGMAVANDFHGVYFTVQALRLYHDLTDCEIIIVDNAPDTPHGQAVKEFIINWASKSTVSIRYIPFTAVTGTAAPRQHIFDQAESEAVLVMDPHVFLCPDAIARLKHLYCELFTDQPGQHYPPLTLTNRSDLFSGPLVFDDFQTIATEMEDKWRDQMRGIWHTDSRGLDAHNPAYPITGMGLGLFTCRRDAWLGFNPHFKGFGGEEIYIHNKFRAAGRQCWCLPWLRWVHRFPRPEGVPYRLSRYHKVRNAVLGSLELGESLDPIYRHFVQTIDEIDPKSITPKCPEGKPYDKPLLSEARWAYLIEDPIRHDEPPTAELSPDLPQTIADMFTVYQSIPRDLDKHFPVLKKLASYVEHATELGQRRESTIALMAGLCPTLISYNAEQDITPHLNALAQRHAQDFHPAYLLPTDSIKLPPIERTDLLFIDTYGTFDHLTAELKRHAPSVDRFIVLHDTTLYGVQGQHGGQGLRSAMYTFLYSSPRWYIHYRTNEQYGLTVLACQPTIDSPYLAGPGSALHYLLKTIGIIASASCGCLQMAEQMDDWGVEGCRVHAPTIIGWLRTGGGSAASPGNWGWGPRLTAAFNTLKTGLILKLNPLDPFPGLLSEAIERCQAAQAVGL